MPIPVPLECSIPVNYDIIRIYFCGEEGKAGKLIRIEYKGACHQERLFREKLPHHREVSSVMSTDIASLFKSSLLTEDRQNVV